MRSGSRYKSGGTLRDLQYIQCYVVRVHTYIQKKDKKGPFFFFQRVKEPSVVKKGKRKESQQIGRAECRERVVWYGEVRVGGVVC